MPNFSKRSYIQSSINKTHLLKFKVRITHSLFSLHELGKRNCKKKKFSRERQEKYLRKSVGAANSVRLERPMQENARLPLCGKEREKEGGLIKRELVWFVGSECGV